MPRLLSIGLTMLALSLVLAPMAASADSPSGVHVVQPGDTLVQIALDAGTDADAIAALNGLGDADVLTVGQSLKLPAHSAPATAAPAATPKPSAGASTSGASYTVAVGDTLWDIAQRFGTTPDAIVQANHLDTPDHLSLGTVLSMPAGAKPAAVAAASSTPAAAAAMPKATPTPAASTTRASPTTKQHVVADGETLKDIAASEKVDLGVLIDFNSIDDPGLIKVGQVLRVPSGQAATDSGPMQMAASVPAPAQTRLPTAATTPTPAPATAAPTATPKPQASASPTPSASPAPSSSLAAAGLKFVGSKYVWGGASPSTGFDCSGLLWYLAQQLNKPLSRSMSAQYDAGTHPSRDQLQPGDLVFFHDTFAPGLSHDGIYIGNNQFVHAANETAGVTVSSLSSAYWTAHWYGATRLP